VETPDQEDLKEIKDIEEQSLQVLKDLMVIEDHKVLKDLL
jgi:hypothetical protein